MRCRGSSPWLPLFCHVNLHFSQRGVVAGNHVAYIFAMSLHRGIHGKLPQHGVLWVRFEVAIGGNVEKILIGGFFCEMRFFGFPLCDVGAVRLYRQVRWFTF